jgi:hypothetical protein
VVKDCDWDGVGAEGLIFDSCYILRLGEWNVGYCVRLNCRDIALAQDDKNNKL